MLSLDAIGIVEPAAAEPLSMKRTLVALALVLCVMNTGNANPLTFARSESNRLDVGRPERERADWYFARVIIGAENGQPIQPPSLLGEMVVSLVERYVPIERNVTFEALPHYIAAAMRTMYLQARSSVTDAFILQRMQESPDDAYWTYCGSSVDLMTLLLSAFGVDARPVSLWSSFNDSHVAIEYYSPLFKKYVFYDPLYGVLMIDAQGRPASAKELLAQIDEHGMEVEQWDFRPVRIYGLFSAGYAPANDAMYEYYNQRDYDEILRNYFNVVALRNDYTSFVYFNSGTLLGDSLVRGSWDVYHYFDESRWKPFKEMMLKDYSDTRGGRYRLNFVN